MKNHILAKTSNLALATTMRRPARSRLNALLTLGSAALAVTVASSPARAQDAGAGQDANAGIVRVAAADFHPDAGDITFSEVPLGTVNPTYNPSDYGGGETAPIVTFNGYFAGQSLSNNPNVDCPGAAATACIVGKPTSVLALDPASPTTFTVNDGAAPNSPVLSGSPTFNGPIAILFSKDQAGVGFDAGYFNADHSTGITAFARDGTLLGTVANNGQGIEFLGLVTADGSARIAGVFLDLVGAEPAGFAIDSLRFGLAGQITIPGGGETPQFLYWDGADPVKFANGAVDGGDGIWDATATNWTTATGTPNGAYSPNPGTPVFAGAPGTVTVDASKGAIAVDGMTFSVSDYHLVGDPITLSGTAATIEVGDETPAAADIVTTIDAKLTGAAGLTKTGLGTLILGGINDYTGPTIISEGTLVGSATSFGSGPVTVNAHLVFDQPTDDTFANVISGTGTLVKTGAGALTLTGINDYTGPTTVAEGTLVGSATSFGSGPVTVNAHLVFDQPTDDTFANAISGTGTLVKTGAGALTLTGINDYTGPTTVSEGTLVGSATSFGSGPVTVNAHLVFDQPTDDTFANAISGTGTLVKTGAGALTLTGINDYTGPTTVSEGTLVGSATSFGSGPVTVNAHLVFDQPTDDTFANVISGTGTLVKTGAGALTLTGINDYTGPTTVSEGTLVGSATSFGSGPVTVNATLVIDQPTDDTFANAISGTGALLKTGTGALTLTGFSDFSGTTGVMQGALLVHGTLSDSVVTVASGATLGGDGTVGGIVAQTGATVAPGVLTGSVEIGGGDGGGNVPQPTLARFAAAAVTPAGTIATLTVAGNYAQAAGSTYAVDLTSSGTSDKLAISGSAALASGAKLVVTKLDDARYILGQRYTVLTAAGGLTGSYALSGDTAVSIFYDLVADYDPTHVYLDVAQTHSFASVAVTRNQIAAATGADSTRAGTLHDAIGYLQSAGEARTAFDSISGEIHATVRAAAFEDSRFVREAVYGRLADPGDAKAIWGHAFGSWGHMRGDGNAARYNRDIGGFFLGADLIQSGALKIGLLGGYGHGTLKLPARASSASLNDAYVGAYAGFGGKAFSLRLGGAYTFRDLRTTRSVAFTGFSDTLSAKYSLGIAQAFGEIGYKLPIGAATFEPIASAAWVQVHSGQAFEKGGPAALGLYSTDNQIVVTNLGARLSAGAGSLKVIGAATWRHTGGDRDSLTRLAFAGGSLFEVAAPPVAKDVAALELGGQFALGPRAAFTVSYSGQIGDGLVDHGVKAALRFGF